MQILRLARIALAVSALCSACTAPPLLPSRSPQDLMRAVEYALKHQDTDVFWNLHCWTNVPPSSARSYKAAFHQIFFNNNPSLRPHYSQFELRPLPAGSKTEIRRNDGILIKPNISVLGLVGFNGGDIEYGKDLDGYYWLVPKVKIPLQNPQTAPAE